MPFPFDQSTRPLAPRSPQSWGPPQNTDQSATDMFRFTGDGCIEWGPGAGQLRDMHSICNMNMNSTSEVDAGIDWVTDADTDIISLSPSQLSTSHFNGPTYRWTNDNSQQSSFSDLDLDLEAAAAADISSIKKARRRAQNRQAQRAYRARKEKELVKCKSQIIVLENEVEQVQKILESSPMTLLQDKIVTLETKNRALQREAGKLKDCLHRVAKAMVERGMGQSLLEIIESSKSSTDHPA